MPKPARERLAQLLAGTAPVRADCAAIRLPGDALTLAVDGLGPVPTPIRAAQAKRLIAAARPARYGRGTQTLSDASVRDTWEIKPDQVSLGGPSWQQHLDAALDHFVDELGLPAGARLTAELHSLLIYGKGQFFLPHQDSEKHDKMVASMVVMVPSLHTGGELVVDNAGAEQTYRGSRDALVLVAFYADRRHEVRPVKSGYRVTLTFNLLLSDNGDAAAKGPVQEAASYLTEHFSVPAVSRYGRDRGRPGRLAFLLDHQYTQRGLATGRFKGADTKRVATLRAAAEQAACRSVFALTEIKETWDVWEARDSQRRNWYDDDPGGGADPGGGDGSDDGDYELNSLIDDEIALTWWTGPDGVDAEEIRLALDEHEVCAVTPTKSLTPYESECEGYMGNYGNTLDRWYRRAAVVMWPKANSFLVRAEAGSDWALRTLLDRVEAGDLAGARADAVSLQPIWHAVEPGLLMPALRLAVAVDDPAAARVLLAPLLLETFTVDHARLLDGLAHSYGEPWLLELIGTWDRPNRFPGPSRLDWITDALLPLCRQLRESGAEPIVTAFTDRCWRWLWGRIGSCLDQRHPGRRRTVLAGLGAPLAVLLDAGSAELNSTIVEALRGSEDVVVELLVPTLRAHQPELSPARFAIARDCRTRLARLLDRPARAEDDWSISWTGCGCEVCGRLTDFLAGAAEHTLDWPLATPGRQYVHQQIDAADLPVRHTTRRQGRPYTLQLTKTAELFRRDSEQRRRAGAELAWLTSTFQ